MIKRNVLYSLLEQLLVFTSIFFIVSLFAIDIFAADVEAFQKVMAQPFCAVLRIMKGPFGKGIVMVVIISMGIMLFLGKVSWGVALTFMSGVAILYTADNIAIFLAGNDNKQELCDPAGAKPMGDSVPASPQGGGS